MMTVKELREALEHMPEDAVVAAQEQQNGEIENYQLFIDLVDFDANYIQVNLISVD